MQTSSHTLNGSAVIRNDTQIATLMLTIRAYTAYTPTEHALRLIYSEAITSGAGKYTRQDWLDALGILGADISVSSDDGFISMQLLSIDSTLDKTLKLFLTLCSNPTFSEHELIRIKTNLKNNLLLAKENSSAHAYQMFASTIFKKNDRRTQYPIDTILKEIDAISQADLQRMHRSLWNYEWNYTCGGNADSCSRIVRTVEKIFSIQNTPPLPVYQNSASQTVPKMTVLLTDIPNKQNIDFSIGNALSLTRTHPDFPALALGLNVLGLAGGFAGRLMSTVREKEGLTYGIYARIEETTTNECGVWRISTFFAPKDTIRGLTSTFREITNICEKGITADELKRFKTIMHTRFALIEDSLIKKVAEMHTLKKIGITNEAYTKYKTDIQTLTRTEVDTALQTYIHPSRILISGAGPITHVEKDIRHIEHLFT